MRWLLALVAVSGVATSILVEAMIRGPERTRRWERLCDHSDRRASLWTYLAGQYPDGSADRLDCQEMADWHLARLRGLHANRPSSRSSPEVDAGQESRERALVRRLGLSGRLSPTYGLDEAGPPMQPQAEVNGGIFNREPAG